MNVCVSASASGGSENDPCSSGEYSLFVHSDSIEFSLYCGVAETSCSVFELVVCYLLFFELFRIPFVVISRSFIHSNIQRLYLVFHFFLQKLTFFYYWLNFCCRIIVYYFCCCHNSGFCVQLIKKKMSGEPLEVYLNHLFKSHQKVVK